MVLLAVATVVAGCYQPTYISPEPLAAGDYCGSLALTGYSYPSASVMLQGRAGLGAGVDAGVRLSFPGELCPYVPVGLYGDIKWNFLSSPYLFTADIGCWYENVAEGGMSEHWISDSTWWTAWPGLLIGSRTWYGGARLMIRRGYRMEYGRLQPGWTYAPALLAGASFGDRFRVTPQAEAFWSSNDGFALTLGVNLELHALNRELVDTDWLR
ncbi:MAG: hypothetical protein NTX53_13460 [candidate division WOR-3 bacterium]|nr:hypothetical protein [candidate division WOR-3 bacterium]